MWPFSLFKKKKKNKKGYTPSVGANSALLDKYCERARSLAVAIDRGEGGADVGADAVKEARAALAKLDSLLSRATVTGREDLGAVSALTDEALNTLTKELKGNLNYKVRAAAHAILGLVKVWERILKGERIDLSIYSVKLSAVGEDLLRRVDKLGAVLVSVKSRGDRILKDIESTTLAIAEYETRLKDCDEISAQRIKMSLDNELEKQGELLRLAETAPRLTVDIDYIVSGCYALTMGSNANDAMLSDICRLLDPAVLERALTEPSVLLPIIEKLRLTVDELRDNSRTDRRSSLDAEAANAL